MENISVFDLVVTVLLATATFWGGMRGVVSQVASIATWVLSGLAAARYGSVVGDVVSIPQPWRAPVSALIVFCASLLALSVASRFVKRAVSLAGLKEFDRQAGALFGLFKGCAICVVLTFFCVLASEKTRDLVDDSKFGPYLASVALVLKGSFPESETMTRFETLVGTMESTQAKGGETPSLNSEIAALETYLKNEVLLPEAAEVVEEAESGKETANSGASSLWSRFANDLRGLSGSSGSKSANAAGNSSADVGAASGTVVGNAGAERTNAANGGNGASWNVWGSRADDGARGGATNDGYYEEYEEYAENGNDAGWSEYDGGTESENAETSNGWSDLTTFWTTITGGERSTAAANETSGERRTANYAATTNESLNDFLGVPTSATVRSATPILDESAPRTTDGAILGRPSATTSLIPPLPY